MLVVVPKSNASFPPKHLFLAETMCIMYVCTIAYPRAGILLVQLPDETRGPPLLVAAMLLGEGWGMGMRGGGGI